MEDEETEIDIDSSILEPLSEHFDNNNNNSTTAVTSQTLTYSIEMRPGVLSDQDFYSLVRSLNDKQRDIYHYISNWSSATAFEMPQQMCLFVSGWGRNRIVPS